MQCLEMSALFLFIERGSVSSITPCSEPSLYGIGVLLCAVC